MPPGYRVPEPIVEYAPPTVLGYFSPWFVPPDDFYWEPLLAGDEPCRLISFSSDRGRSDQFDQFDPGTATFVLDDSDRMLDETFEDSLTFPLGAWTPIRLRLLNHYTGNTSTIFTGYITSGFEPSSSATRDRTVTVQAVEWLGAAAEREIPKALIPSMIAAAEPEVWWRGRLTLPRISSSAGKVLGTGTYDGTPVSAARVEVAESLVQGDDDPAMRWHTGARLATDSEVDTTTTSWAFFACFQVVALNGVGRDLAVGRTGSTSGNRRWRVRIGSNGHVAAEIFNAAGTSLLSITADDLTATPVAHNDGEPHWVFAVFNGSTNNIGIVTDLTYQGVFPAGSPYAGTEAGSGGWIVTGAGATDARVIVDELAYFPSDSIVDYTGFAFDQDEGIDAWAGDYISTRLAKLETLGGLDVPSGFWNPYVTTDTGFANVGGYVPQQSLGAAVEATGQALCGGAFSTRGGGVQVFGYNDLSDAWFTTVTANFSNYEHAVDPIRYSGEGRTGRLNARVINEVRARGAVLARDAASILNFGTRVLDFESLKTDDITTYAAEIVAERKDPTPEVGALTINPVGSETATTWLLEECELARLVTYEELTADGHWLSRYGSMQIQSEAWSWSNGLDWTVTLKLAGGAEYELISLLTEDDDLLTTEADGEIIVGFEDA